MFKADEGNETSIGHKGGSSNGTTGLLVGVLVALEGRTVSLSLLSVKTVYLKYTNAIIRLMGQK